MSKQSDVINLLNKRSSIRSFLDKDIPNDVLNIILEAGRLSPSGGNEQPWKFGVITNKELIHTISQLAYNQKWIATSPLLIVMCTEIIDDQNGGRDIQKRRFPFIHDKIADMDKTLYSSLNLEEHQTKIPGTHMMLAALEQGIYSTWISYFDVVKLQDLLGLPQNIIPSEIIAFGYPKGKIAKRSKKHIDNIVFYNHYDK